MGVLFLVNSNLYFLDRKACLNSEEYQKMLKFAAKKMKRLKVTYLMEDEAKCHTAIASCKYRTDNGIKGYFFFSSIENAYL